MTSRIHVRSGRRTIIMVAALLAAVAVPPRTCAAQDVIRSIFGLFGAAARPDPDVTGSTAGGRLSYAEPAPKPLDLLPPAVMHGGTSFCVRLCDGRFFPLSSAVAPSGGAGSHMCAALCPAAATAVFYGAAIDDAVADSGRRYGDLTNAFVFRTRIVAGCTCTGRDGFGLARIDPARDPSLRAGDVVAGPDGLKIVGDVRAGDRRPPVFTPVAGATGLSTEFRRRLATMRVSSGARY